MARQRSTPEASLVDIAGPHDHVVDQLRRAHRQLVAIEESGAGVTFQAVATQLTEMSRGRARRRTSLEAASKVLETLGRHPDVVAAADAGATSTPHVARVIASLTALALNRSEAFEDPSRRWRASAVELAESAGLITAVLNTTAAAQPVREVLDYRRLLVEQAFGSCFVEIDTWRATSPHVIDLLRARADQCVSTGPQATRSDRLDALLQQLAVRATELFFFDREGQRAASVRRRPGPAAPPRRARTA